MSSMKYKLDENDYLKFHYFCLYKEISENYYSLYIGDISLMDITDVIIKYAYDNLYIFDVNLYSNDGDNIGEFSRKHH